jgi:NADH-quinone oxidoreductase subunit H
MNLVWPFAKVAFAIGWGMNIAGFLGWVERKQSAVLQDRIGANRASILGFTVIGLFHPIADAIKMLTKEDFVAKGTIKPLHTLAPAISLGMGLFCLAALPFGGIVTIAGKVVSLQPIESTVGLLLVAGMLSLGVHGVVMAGYASGSNYGLLGGLRGAAQMISSEVCIASTLAAVAAIYGTLDLQAAVRWQAEHGLWGVLLQPLGFILFLTAGAAVTKRTPFDIPEGESEIVGYHVEYSGMKFGMFLISDFIESIVISGLAVALYFGGWHVPGLQLDGIAGGLVMVLAFTTKVMLILFLLMQVRWTLPRFRFDQVLDLGWKNILPLSLLNFVLTVWGIYLWQRG